MTDPGTAALLESWTLSLHDKRPGTRALYLRVAKWFSSWLIDHDRPVGAPGDLLAVSRQDAEAWFTAQRAAGLAPTTIRSRWIALRNLYRWLTEEDEVDTNPMSRVKVAKVEPDPDQGPRHHDLRALLKACEREPGSSSAGT